MDEVHKQIKVLENAIKSLKKQVGMKDEKEDLEELEEEPMNETVEVGRGRKKRTIPKLAGTFGEKEEQEETT